MDRSHGIARLPRLRTAGMRIATGRSGGLALGASAVVALLVLGVTLGLMVVGPPVPERWPERPPSPAASLLSPLPAPMPARAMLGHGDTIDGQTVVDGIFIERMKQVAARIPPAVLAGHSRDPRVRYLAQAFTPGDDPGLTEGWFEDPMAALAFGCAVDTDLDASCMPDYDLQILHEAAQATAGVSIEPEGPMELVRDADSAPEPSASGARADEALAGWRCRPLGLAIGAPAFEPYRCAPS